MRLVSAVLNVSLTQGGFTKLKLNQGGARPSLDPPPRGKDVKTQEASPANRRASWQDENQ